MREGVGKVGEGGWGCWAEMRATGGWQDPQRDYTPMSCLAMARLVMSNLNMSFPVCLALPCHVPFCLSMSCPVLAYLVLSCHVQTCYVMYSILMPFLLTLL